MTNNGTVDLYVTRNIVSFAYVCLTSGCWHGKGLNTVLEVSARLPEIYIHNSCGCPTHLPVFLPNGGHSSLLPSIPISIKVRSNLLDFYGLIFVDVTVDC